MGHKVFVRDPVRRCVFFSSKDQIFKGVSKFGVWFSLDKSTK